MTRIMWVLLIIGFILLGMFYQKQNEMNIAPDETNTYIIATMDSDKRQLI